MKKLFFIKILAAFCILGSVPAIAMAAEPSQKINPSSNLTGYVKKSAVTGPMLNGGANSSNTSGTVSPQAAQGFNGGTATMYAYAIGDRKLDADWTLISDLGPITYVNMTTKFDDGSTVPQAYNCWGSTQYNVAQHKFSKTGYHTATFSGWGYQDMGLISFTVPPLNDGDNVY